MNGPEEGTARELVVGDNEKSIRLDAYLGHSLESLFSRSKVKKLIQAGSIRVDGRCVSPHYRVKPGERIHVEWTEPCEDAAPAEAIPIDILYEDEDLLIVNKPAGMVVHPAHGNPSHTLVNALLYHVRTLKRFSNQIRPGIVHRLDKDTSGVMVIAKHERAHDFLARQFRNHKIQKVYQAVVRHVVQRDEGVCEEPVGRAFLNRKKVVIKPSGGKDAVTYFRILRRFRRATLVEVRPKTGRTHQIRVHMAHLGHPVLGDSLYGIKSPWINRQALHAHSLTFTHPSTHKTVYFEAPVPEDINRLMNHLEKEG
jgi:23S rRNA pseudouridine1911/1915/1917 synthase